MTKILLLGIDGMRLDVALEDGVAPNLAGLAQTGALLEMWMHPPTDSGPGWATLLTGRPHSETRVYDNEMVGNDLARCPDFLSQVYFANHHATTMAAVVWPELVAPESPGPVIHQRVDQQRTGQHKVILVEPDRRGCKPADRAVLSQASWLLSREGPDASFVYFEQVDEAGHLHGSMGPEYREAISTVDEYLRHLVKAVEERVQLHGEEWILAVTTDHGHKPGGGHGEDEEEVRRSFLLLHAFGTTLPGLPSAVDPTEVTPLLLELAGSARPGALAAPPAHASSR